MRLTRYIFPLVSAFLLLITSACHSYKPQTLLSTIPQDVDYLAYLHLEKLSKLVSDEALGYHIEPRDKECLEKLGKYVAWKEILAYGAGDDLYITLHVKNADALLTNLRDYADSINSENGLNYAYLNGWNVAFSEKQIWISQQGFFTSLFERSQDLVAGKGESAADIAGIKDLLQQDFSLYLNLFHTQEQIESVSWLAALAPDLQEKVRNTHFIVNGSFKEKELKLDYKLVNNEGDIINDEYNISQKVDKEILNYLADDCDLVVLQGLEGKGLVQLFSKIDNKANTKEWETILGALDGTVAFSASFAPNGAYNTENWSLVAQVKKGEETPSMVALLEVLGVDPMQCKRLGDDYIVTHPRYGEFYVGARKRIIFAASRPVNKFTPSFESRPITRAIQSGVGNILLDIPSDGYLSQSIAERHNYHFEGYAALRAESLGSGKLVLHNDVEKEGNILNGILKALRPIPVDEAKILVQEEVLKHE